MVNRVRVNNQTSNILPTTPIDISTMEMWTPPTFSAGRVPQVTPGTSGDQKIDGDFPLDQVVIDRKFGDLLQDLMFD